MGLGCEEGEDVEERERDKLCVDSASVEGEGKLSVGNEEVETIVCNVDVSANVVCIFVLKRNHKSLNNCSSLALFLICVVTAFK